MCHTYFVLLLKVCEDYCYMDGYVCGSILTTTVAALSGADSMKSMTLLWYHISGTQL